MSEPPSNDAEIPARGKKLPHPFLPIGNEVFDLFLPIMGADCFVVYAYFVRRHYSDPTLRHDIRSVADSCGLSPTTALRACEVLEHFSLVKLRRFGGSRQSECELPDSWDVATRLGAEYDSQSKSYLFPAQVSKRLYTEVREIRERQQGQKKGSKAPKIVCGNLPLRVSRRSTGVSPEKRQRAIRETQAGTHLIQKEERSERTPTPTPTPRNSSATQTEKADPEKDDPSGLLPWARMKFTGVIDDMRNHLLDTSKPPHPRLRNGYQDWEEFGFAHMAIEAAEFRGAVLMLVITAPNPAAANRGLAKYHRAWAESVR